MKQTFIILFIVILFIFVALGQPNEIIKKILTTVCLE